MHRITFTAAAVAGIMLLASGAVRHSGVAAQARAAQQESTASQSVAQHIATFDDLDFNVFTNQHWDRFSKSHSQDVVVHWPDGHQTKGLAKHIEDLKGLFAYAPDTRITVHPIKFGSGEWTSVIGVMEGTFSKPMPTPSGQPVAPTGKAFKISMNTVSRWNAQGTMDEEWLFWDNATYLSQIGLSK